MPSNSRMGRLRDHDSDFIRTIARVRFTDLVDECSRSGSEVVTGFSVVGCRADDNTISQYVHEAAISRAPFQLHLMVSSLGHHTRLEHNVCSGPGWLLVEESILLGLAANGHAPVHPCRDVVIDQRSAVVVVARIAPYDAGVRLGR